MNQLSSGQILPSCRGFFFLGGGAGRRAGAEAKPRGPADTAQSAGQAPQEEEGGDPPLKRGRHPARKERGRG